MERDFDKLVMESADASGNVSDEQMAGMLFGQGDTEVKTSDTGEPIAELVEDPAPKQPAAETPAGAPAPTPAPAPPEPVLMAKDGVHTIEYQKLVDAREEAAVAKAALDVANAEIERMRQAPAPAPASAAPAAAPAPAVEEVSDDPFGDWSPAAVAKGLDKAIAKATEPLLAKVATLEQELAAKVEPLHKAAQASAVNAHEQAILSAHPDAYEVVESPAFKAWVDAQPAYARPGIEQVVKEGSAKDSVELITAFKATQPAPAAVPAAKSAADIAAAAAAKVAALEAKEPVSLSDLPTGTPAHHEESAALLAMSPEAMQAKFASMTPEQIEAAIARAI